MNLLCALGRHHPAPLARWNHGYYFSRCQRCGQDLVRTAFETWHVPHGYRVVWSATPPTSLRTATLAPQQSEGSAPDGRALQDVGTAASSTYAAEPTVAAATSSPTGNLPISEVLTLLRQDEAKSEGALERAAATTEPERRQFRPVDEVPSSIDDFMASDELADKAGFWADEGAAGDDRPPPSMENLAAEVKPPAEVAKSAQAAPQLVSRDEISTAPVRLEPDVVWPSANKAVGARSQDEAVAETLKAPETVRSESDAAAEPVTPFDEPGPPTHDAASPSSKAAVSQVVEEERAGGLSSDDGRSSTAALGARVAGAASSVPFVEAPEATRPVVESGVAAPHPRDKADWPSAAPTQAQANLVGMDEPRQRFGMVLGLGVVAAVLIAAAWFLVFRGNPFGSGQMGAVSAPEAETASGEKIVVPTGSTPAYVTARLLNCRASSELRSHSVTILPRGALVRVIAREPGWISVAYEGRQCWVAERYLSAERPL